MDSLPTEIYLCILQYLPPLDLLRFICAAPCVATLLTTSRAIAFGDEEGNTVLHLLAEAETGIGDEPTTNGNHAMQAEVPGWREARQLRTLADEGDAAATGQNASSAPNMASMGSTFSTEWRRVTRLPTRLPSPTLPILLMSLFLKNQDIDPNLKDGYGLSPLNVAVRYRNAGMVSFLLAHERVDANLRGRMNITPLCQATVDRMEDMVALLLSHPRVDVNDWAPGGMPLIIVKSRRRRKVLRQVIGIEAFDFKKHEIFSKDMFLDTMDIIEANDEAAVIERNWDGIEMVQDLLAQTRLDVNGYGLLISAAKGGDYRIAELLLRRDDILVNLVDEVEGMTALAHAARRGDERIVTMLLAREDVEVDSLDNKGRTPLFHAYGAYMDRNATAGRSVAMRLSARGADTGTVDRLMGV